MPERILLVDDEQVVLDAVRKLLREDDVAIDAVLTAAEALDRLAAAPYRLVISDLMMPEMDGLALLERVREIDPATAVILITGYPTVQTALRARQLGAFEYVTKPFTRQELRSVVLRALRSAAPGAPPPVSPAPAYYIPDHAWVVLENGGAARVGMATAFARTAGEIESLRLPAVGDRLEQGRVCALLVAADGVEHSLHAPLSGRVIEVNPALLAAPGLAARDPELTGWLLRLTPDNAAREIQNLTPSPPPG